MRFEDLHKYLTRCVSTKTIPGCVCWIGNRTSTHFFREYGSAQLTPHPVEMKKNTVFDIASITKPLCTALSIMILHERQLLNINDHVGDALDRLKNSLLGPRTIKELLTHITGLPAWYPTYLIPEDRRLEHIASLVTNQRKVIYSCLGYIILGKIVESVSGIGLNDFFSNNIAERLGLYTIQFGPVVEKDNVAATEHGSVHEQEMAGKYGNTSSIEWRDRLIKGEVHDGNAFYAFHGVAGNAGLFSNVEDLATLTQSYLSGNVVSRTSVEMMIADHTGDEEKRGLGWRIDPYPGILSSAAFGHTGFTGTMVLIDPNQDLIIILLANAVHPKVQLGLMNPIREKVVRIVTKTINNG